MSAGYGSFLDSKAHRPPNFGREPDPIHPELYDFQVALVNWAIRRGRAALFCDTGLGKTLMQLEWARQSADRALILAPLAVAEQTVAEAKSRLGLDIRRVDRPADGPGIQITNYEKLQHFVGVPYGAIVLDESSILKSLDGKTRTLLLKEFAGIERRLCCTATPAPNDVAELANHAEFLGAMPRADILASFFVHDSDGAGAGKWRLKGHGQDAFWRWVAKWAAYVRKPSDLGFDDRAWALPPLTIRDDMVSSDWKPKGLLFAKDPQAQAIRTKSKALMFVQKDKDSSWLRPAMADYILFFRHPGLNETPIKPDVSNDEWISWARPIWYGIRESETLNAAEARSEKDERHICPLQLETIERCVRLWSNAGEIVFSPFGGIGSEGYVSLQKDRRYIGIELKPEYWRQAVRNLKNAKRQLSLGGVA